MGARSRCRRRPEVADILSGPHSVAARARRAPAEADSLSSAVRTTAARLRGRIDGTGLPRGWRADYVVGATTEITALLWVCAPPDCMTTGTSTLPVPVRVSVPG